MALRAALCALRIRSRAPANQEPSALMGVTRQHLHGAVPGGLSRDGRDRGESRHTSHLASVRAVACGASVVSVRPHRRPRNCGAERGRHAGCAGLASRTLCPGPAALARKLSLRILPRRSAWRRARLARFCAAPAAVAAWSSGRKLDPRPPLGLVASAPVLDALE